MNDDDYDDDDDDDDDDEEEEEERRRIMMSRTSMYSSDNFKQPLVWMRVFYAYTPLR